MKKLVLCTVGTSITNGCPSQHDSIRKLTDWNDILPDFEQEVSDWIKRDVSFRSLSAETNSLDRLGISANDLIILLTSDNAAGRISAEGLQRVIIGHYGLGEARVVIRRIPGLQVHDAKRLRETGLKNFVGVALEYLNNPEYQYSYDTILNPTGGFKGVLPFLTVLGMLFGKKSVYIFEFSDELITLPPLPFTFDLALFERAKPALEYIEKNVGVSEQEYLGRIQHYVPEERELFMAFTEPLDQKVTLSPLAYSLLSIEAEQSVPMIAESARKKLEAIDGTNALAVKRLVRKSVSAIWRNRHIEHWHSTDLLVIKQPRTAERLAGFIKQNQFYITHVFADHDKYEQSLSKHSRKDFERAVFVPWEETCRTGVDESNRDDVVEERDNLLLETQALKEKLSQNEDVLYQKEVEILDLQEKLSGKTGRKPENLKI